MPGFFRLGRGLHHGLGRGELGLGNFHLGMLSSMFSRGWRRRHQGPDCHRGFPVHRGRRGLAFKKPPQAENNHEKKDDGQGRQENPVLQEGL